MEAVYDYLTSPQFAQKLRAVYDAFRRMKTELDSDAFFKKLIEDEFAFLKAAGMKETNMSADDTKNVEKYWNEGLWKMSQQSNADAGKKFEALVLQKGMSR